MRILRVATERDTTRVLSVSHELVRSTNKEDPTAHVVKGYLIRYHYYSCTWYC